MRILLASLVLAAGIGAVQPALAGSSHRSAARQARAHLAAAEKALMLGDSSLAVVELKAAYFRDPQPRTLFELAEVCRRAADFERAAFFYRRYLSYAPPSQRETVERLARLVEAAVERAREVREAGPMETLAMPTDLQLDADTND
jgi:hypothetical protein